MKEIIPTLKLIHSTYKYCQSVLMLVVMIVVVGGKFWAKSKLENRL